jgi:hypothetical protein
MANRPGSTPNVRWDGLLLVLGCFLAGAAATLWYLPLVAGPPVRWASAVVAGLLIVFALIVLQALGEGATELLRRLPPVRRCLQWLDVVTASRRFSWIRIGVALIPMTALLVLMMLVTYLVKQATAGK